MKPAAQLPWMPLTAEQLIVKDRGFVWKARARKGPIFVTAADHYLDGAGQIFIALFGLIPVVSGSGPDLSKSAMAQLLIEGLALPSAFLPSDTVRIEGIDDSRFFVTVQLQGETTTLTLTVDEEGRLREVTLPRWGTLTEDGSYQAIPYGARLTEERSVGGYTFPTRFADGWWYGTDRYLEVIQLSVDDVDIS